MITKYAIRYGVTCRGVSRRRPFRKRGPFCLFCVNEYEGHIMNRAHDRPGAVILGGGFACLEAARNLDKCGVRVCVVGSATSVARFSRSVGRFVKWPRGLKDEELPDFLVAMAEKYGLRGWVLFPSCDDY